ncbi:GNAT family N-acetyltransferase [Euzebya sp.]|uniref:GNAT family N-acetyltransferase n=1 Tax=Euzebya sp. TaxID=1971409 RepID=UPI00351414C6
MRPVDDPAEILAIYQRAPHVHPYGIADVVQLWPTSTWWRRGDAVVGLLDLPGGDVVYSVTADPSARPATLELLADLAAPARGDLPDAFTITGPTGLTAALEGAGYTARWADAYDKLHLPPDAPLPDPPDDLVVLDRADVPAMTALFATDPDAGDFFHAGLVDTGFYLGRREGRSPDGVLVAVAGVHVVEPGTGVAAIGNVATHPSHRRRGHGRAVVVGLVHRLREVADVIGLNVRHRTAPARALYRDLGFLHATTYEEAAVVRGSPR